MHKVILCFVFSAVMFGYCVGCTGQYMANVRPEKLYQKQPGSEIPYKKTEQLHFKKSAFSLFGIPISTPNLVASIDTEIQKAQADAVSNLSITAIIKSYLVVGFTEYHIQGDLIEFQ
jgi:hypothetical protein